MGTRLHVKLFWGLSSVGALLTLVGIFGAFSSGGMAAKSEWDPMSLAQTGLGLLAAASLQVLLVHDSDRSKREGELVLKEVERVQTRLNDAIQAIHETAEGASEKSRVNSATKNLGMAIVDLEEVLRQMDPVDERGWCRQLQHEHRQVRAALTGPFQPTDVEVSEAAFAARGLRVQLFRIAREVGQ